MSALIDTTESNLWVAVIEQALIDATFGLGVVSGGGKKRNKPKCIGNYLMPCEVEQARSFISGSTGALKDICDALGMDYEATRGQLIGVYNSCLPHMPEGWRQAL